MKLTERGKVQQKKCKIDRFVVKSLVKSICKRFRNTENREKLNLKLDPQIEETLCNKRRNYIHQYKEVKEKLYPIFFFMSEQHLSIRSKISKHLKNFKFFLVFAGQKHISHAIRATKEQVH